MATGPLLSTTSRDIVRGAAWCRCACLLLAPWTTPLSPLPSLLHPPIPIPAPNCAGLGAELLCICLEAFASRRMRCVMGPVVTLLLLRLLLLSLPPPPPLSLAGGDWKQQCGWRALPPSMCGPRVGSLFMCLADVEGPRPRSFNGKVSNSLFHLLMFSTCCCPPCPLLPLPYPHPPPPYTTTPRPYPLPIAAQCAHLPNIPHRQQQHRSGHIPSVRHLCRHWGHEQ